MSADDQNGGILVWRLSGDQFGKLISQPYVIGHTWSSIAVGSQGDTYVAATDTINHNMDVKYSVDLGEHWGDTMTNLGLGLSYGTIMEQNGQLHICGWKDGYVWFASSSQYDLSREVLDGTNTLLTVCAAPAATVVDAPRSSLTIHSDGSVWVAVGNATGLDVYKCKDYRTGFTLIDT